MCASGIAPTERGLSLVWWRFSKYVRLAEKALYYASSFLAMATMILVAADVTGRYVFSRPIEGSLELCEFFMVGIVLFGVAYTQQRGGHVAVEIVYDRLGGKTKHVLRVFLASVGLVLFPILTWLTSIPVIEAIQRGLTSDVLGIPAFPFRAFVPLSFFFLALEHILELVSIIYEPTSGRIEEPEPELSAETF